MRIRDWRVPFCFLVLCAATEISFGGTNTTTPIFPHKDPNEQREFQRVYQTTAQSPTIFTGAGAPAFSPQKTGDTYISTTTQKIYISTATATKASWMIIN